MMGTTVIENSKSEKYLGDQIHEDRCEASITATLNGRIPGAIEAAEDIINLINHSEMMGHKMAYAAVEQYEMKVASKILTNCDSWIGLTNKQIDRIQTVQDNFFKQVFQVSPKGTPLCMVRIDSQTLHIKWQIIMKKIKQVRKTMDKTENNICKSALVAGQNTCAGEDLLNECKAWCNKLNIRCVTRGTDPIPANPRNDDYKLKKYYTILRNLIRVRPKGKIK